MLQLPMIAPPPIPFPWLDELYGGNLSESDGIDGLELIESFDEPDLSEVPELSDDLGGLLVIVDVFGEFSEEDCLCLAVIMLQITKMIITQYMNCLLYTSDAADD